jgi:hypothetical protein
MTETPAAAFRCRRADFGFVQAAVWAKCGQTSDPARRRIPANGETRMKFEVVGQNRDTGARMALEFEAESKAAAERKATSAGMSVHHVRDVTDGHAGGTGANPAYRGPIRAGGGKFVRLVLLVVIVAVAWYFWTHRHMLMHR